MRSLIFSPADKQISPERQKNLPLSNRRPPTRKKALDQVAMVAARIASMRQGERTDLVEISTRLSQPQAAA